MAENWAICIGINKYENLPEIRFAVQDAKCMKDWFEKEAGFKKVYLFTDNSDPIEDGSKPYSSHPTYATLMRFLYNRFQSPFLSLGDHLGDNLWFFFSGHGLIYADRDYLMLSDSSGKGDLIEKTAISLSYITERLRRSGADNIIVVQDACRNEGGSKGLGVGGEKHKGIISIYSCSPSERSFEIEEKQNGSFTYALLESLRIEGTENCATVERLNQRLRYRVPELNRQYKKDIQTPYVVAEPISKSKLILLPAQAQTLDLDALRAEAYRAENRSDSELAKMFMTQVLIASPADPDALQWFKKIWLQELKWQYEIKNQELAKSHQTKIKELEQSLQDKIKQLQQQLETERSHSNQLQEIYRASQQEKQDLKHSYQKQIQKLQDDLRREKLHFTSEREKLEKKQQTEIQELRQYYQARINQLQTENQKQVAKIPDIELKSSKGVDKTKLRDLLTAGKCREADQETSSVMVPELEKKALTITKKKPKLAKEKSIMTQVKELIFGIKLKSSKGVNYTKLRDLLAAGKWFEADQETTNVMLQAANRIKQRDLRVEDIDNFPCDDLRTIDQLWVKYSKGKFGFSVQKKIYMDDLGGTRDSTLKTWEEFCDRVGWRKGGSYVRYSDLTFELDTTPWGHLPWVLGWGPWDVGECSVTLSLLSRKDL